MSPDRTLLKYGVPLSSLWPKRFKKLDISRKPEI